MNSLRIIFMGTPEFAVPSLEILLQHQFNVVAVVTSPDRQQGRGQKLTISPVKACAIKYSIPILQPTNLKSPDFLEELKKYNATLQVVVAFRMLPEAVWAMPSSGTFNLHASLLPDYRGAAPINWAIINGEHETGLTTFFLQQEIDTGQIILQVKEGVTSEDDAGSLAERMKLKGADLVLKTVQAIQAGNVKPVPQAIAKIIKVAPKIFKSDCQINWSKTAGEIRNFVRGLSPYPAAWTVIEDRTYKVFKVSLPSASPLASGSPFTTDNKTYLYFKAADGWLSVDELQPEGKKRMTVAAFFRGNKI